MVWDRIARAQGFVSEEEIGEAARARFLQHLPFTEGANFKGPKAAKSRWYSVQAALKWQQPDWWTKVMLIMYVVIRKGWVMAASEFSAPSAWRTKEIIDSLRDPAQCEGAPDAEAPGAGAAALSVEDCVGLAAGGAASSTAAAALVASVPSQGGAGGFASSSSAVAPPPPAAVAEPATGSKLSS